MPTEEVKTNDERLTVEEVELLTADLTDAEIREYARQADLETEALGFTLKTKKAGEAR